MAHWGLLRQKQTNLEELEIDVKCITLLKKKRCYFFSFEISFCPTNIRKKKSSVIVLRSKIAVFSDVYEKQIH